MALGNNPIKRQPLHPISFEGALARSVEQIRKESLQYRTVQIKIFENCEVRPPQLDPANMEDGPARATDMDRRLLMYIQEMSSTKEDVCMHDGKRHEVEIPKKTVLITVSYPLYTILVANGYVVGSDK